MRIFLQKPRAPQQTSEKSDLPNRAHFGRSDVVNSILHLQRTIGNKAVQRLLAGNMVNVAGDAYEREADHVSGQVMRMPESRLQRACDCGGECPKCQTKQSVQENERLQTMRDGSSNLGQTAVPSIVNEVLASSGQSLDTGTRAFMEPRFEQDFSEVRVHTDAKAAESAKAMDAQAYTVGQEVVFANGSYAPGTGQGRFLLAHELAHVIQQRSGGGGVAVAHGPALDRDADGAAALVTAGLNARVDSAPAADAGAAVPQFKKWKGAYLDEKAVVKYLVKSNNLSEAEAKKQAPAIIAKLKKTGEALVAAYPGLKDRKFDYDLFQDIVVGPDRKLPNCFGDVCKAGKQRWEPTKPEQDAWLKSEGYASTKSCTCECGIKKVAVYEITMVYKDGGKSENFMQPYHIAEQQEDCTWRSRLGDLGVIIHDQADQLVSQAAADALAQDWAATAGVTFQSAKVALLCYAKKHDRKDYHGGKNGPLSCSTGKK